MNTAVKKILHFQAYNRNHGYKPSLGSHEKRKLGLFNLMNFLGLLIGTALPVTSLFTQGSPSLLLWLLTGSPALTSLLVFTANYYEKYEFSRMCYFILYPVITCCIYALKIDLGIEFFFVLYGVLSVFFLRNIFNIILSFSLSMTGYFLAGTFWKNYNYSRGTNHHYLFVCNHLLAIFFISYALLLIKTQTTRYHHHTHTKNFQ